METIEATVTDIRVTKTKTGKSQTWVDFDSGITASTLEEVVANLKGCKVKAEIEKSGKWINLKSIETIPVEKIPEETPADISTYPPSLSAKQTAVNYAASCAPAIYQGYITRGEDVNEEDFKRVARGCYEDALNMLGWSPSD